MVNSSYTYTPSLNSPRVPGFFFCFLFVFGLVGVRIKQSHTYVDFLLFLWGWIDLKRFARASFVILFARCGFLLYAFFSYLTLSCKFFYCFYTRNVPTNRFSYIYHITVQSFSTTVVDFVLDVFLKKNIKNFLRIFVGIRC